MHINNKTPQLIPKLLCTVSYVLVDLNIKLMRACVHNNVLIIVIVVADKT